MSTDTIVQLFIPTALATIMFAMGLGLTMADFRRIIERPRAVAAGAVAQLVVLPLVGFATAFVFGLPTPLAVGLVLLTACPGGPSSNLYSHMAGGDTALSVTLTALSGVVTIVTIPLITNLAMVVFAGETTVVTLPVLDTIARIFIVVGLPLAVGMVVRAKQAERAKKLEPIVKRVAVVLLSVLVVGAVAKESSRIAGFIATAGVPVVTMNAIGMLLGLAIALGLKLPPRQTVTITIEVGMQNAAMAIGIATGLLNSTEIAIPAVIYALVAYVTCAIAGVAGHRWLKRIGALSA